MANGRTRGAHLMKSYFRIVPSFLGGALMEECSNLHSKSNLAEKMFANEAFNEFKITAPFKSINFHLRMNKPVDPY